MDSNDQSLQDINRTSKSVAVRTTIFLDTVFYNSLTKSHLIISILLPVSFMLDLGANISRFHVITPTHHYSKSQ